MFEEHLPWTLFDQYLLMVSVLMFVLAFCVRLAFLLREKIASGQIERDDWKLTEPRLMTPLVLYAGGWVTFLLFVAIPWVQMMFM